MIQSSSCDYNASSCTFRVMGARLQATRHVGPLGHQLLARDSNRPCCVACAVLLCVSLPMHACGRSGFDAGHVCCIVMMCICMIPGAGTPRGFAPQFLVPHVNEVRAEGTGWTTQLRGWALPPAQHCITTRACAWTWKRRGLMQPAVPGCLLMQRCQQVVGVLCHGLWWPYGPMRGGGTLCSCSCYVSCVACHGTEARDGWLER